MRVRMGASARVPPVARVAWPAAAAWRCRRSAPLTHPRSGRASLVRVGLRVRVRVRVRVQRQGEPEAEARGSVAATAPLSSGHAWLGLELGLGLG